MSVKKETMGCKETVVAVLRRGKKKKIIRETWWTKLKEFLARRILR